jgi:hypothetical protein
MDNYDAATEDFCNVSKCKNSAMEFSDVMEGSEKVDEGSGR